MKNILFFFLTFVSVGFSQNKADLKDYEKEFLVRKSIRKGNELLKKNDTLASAISYQKALDLDGVNYKALNNLGTAHAESKHYKEAEEHFMAAASASKDKKLKAKAFHNLGVTQEQQKKYKEAVKSYKKALVNNPKDEETRYNLANALRLLKKQQQQQNKDNKDNKDKKDDQKNQDQKDQNKDNKNDKENRDDKKDSKDKNKQDQKDDSDKKDDQNKKDDQKDGDQDKKDQQNKKQEQDKGDKDKKQQPNPSKLSAAQMQQLLGSLKDKEEQTQKKINAQKVKVKTKSNEKDW